MLSEKLIEVITSPPDAALTLVTEGEGGPHLANSWNSYLEIDGDRLLLPVGGMKTTEANLAARPVVQLSIANRQVEGLSYKGTGYLVRGLGEVKSQGAEFDRIRERFPWARAALVITVTNATQTL
jgi:hypothetical protein